MRFITTCISLYVASAIRLTIDPMRHSVSPVTRSDFDAVISKFRDRQVSAVYFYRPDESDSSKYFEPLNAIGAELRGMFKFAAVNCDDQAKLCTDEGVSDLPVIMLYPIRPLSPEPYPRSDMDTLGDEKGLKKVLYRMLPSQHIQNLNEGNILAFQENDEHLPKVVLFSNKKTSPPLFKALSSEFSKEIHFGFYPSPSDEVLKSFKLKPGQVPKLVLQESGHGGKGKKFHVYDQELSFQAIHEWINVRRETFARGGGFAHADDGANPAASNAGVNAKPWLAQEVPEMYKQSHRDLCFKHDEGLCVIYLKEGELSVEETRMLKAIKNDAGEELRFRFMWMDLAKEPNFQKLFAPESLPNVVVFNPHKRLRFTLPSEEPVDEAYIGRLLDKIKAGDGRFKIVPELPEFAARKAAQPEKDEL